MTELSVVVAADAAPLARKAAELLADRAGRRLGRSVAVVAEARGEVLAVLSEDGPDVGFWLRARPGEAALVAAADPRQLVFGVGELLRSLGQERSVASAPVKARRPIYFATHFGNWYVHADLDDVRRYVEDLALAGYNELVTWFDLHHFTDLDDGAEQWSRLRALDELARGVGMGIGRIAIANESFAGQAPPELRATGRVPGTGYETDLCPSKPEARRIILEVRQAVLERLRDTTHVDWICLWPYDQGGCNCADCTPWPQTYLDLCRDIAAMAPDFELVVSAWWIGTHVAGEDESFFEGLARGEKWFHTVMAGTVELRRWLAEGRAVPAQYDVLLFPEISMFDGTPWGGRGANPAPKKFAAEMAELGPHLVGAMPYSEGRYEDLNKFVWARLQWDPSLDVADVVAEYCRSEFGIDASEFVLALEAAGGSLHGAAERDAAAAALEAAMPAWGREGWRWQMLRARTRLDALRAAWEAGDQSVKDELRSVYDDMQLRLHRHDPERSLHFWIHLPFEEWLDVPFNQYVLPTGSSS